VHRGLAASAGRVPAKTEAFRVCADPCPGWCESWSRVHEAVQTQWTAHGPRDQYGARGRAPEAARAGPSYLSEDDIKEGTGGESARGSPGSWRPEAARPSDRAATGPRQGRDWEEIERGRGRSSRPSTQAPRIYVYI
jgi:hypothetical protein